MQHCRQRSVTGQVTPLIDIDQPEAPVAQTALGSSSRSDLLTISGHAACDFALAGSAGTGCVGPPSLKSSGSGKDDSTCTMLPHEVMLFRRRLLASVSSVCMRGEH